MDETTVREGLAIIAEVVGKALSGEKTRRWRQKMTGTEFSFFKSTGKNHIRIYLTRRVFGQQTNPQSLIDVARSPKKSEKTLLKLRFLDTSGWA